MTNQVAPTIINKVFAEAAAAMNGVAPRTETATHGRVNSDDYQQPVPQDLNFRLQILLAAQNDCLLEKAEQLRQLERENRELREKNLALNLDSNTILVPVPNRECQRESLHRRRESFTSDSSDLIKFSPENSPLSRRRRQPPRENSDKCAPSPIDPSREPFATVATSNTYALQPYHHLDHADQHDTADLIDLGSPASGCSTTCRPSPSKSNGTPIENLSPARASERQKDQGLQAADQLMVIPPNRGNGDSDSTAVIITGLPADVTYHTLLLSLASIHPGRIKEVKITEYSEQTRAARVIFFTHAAAARMVKWGTMRDTRPKAYINGEVVYPSFSWYGRYVAPSEPDGRSRIIMVRGPPALLTMPNITLASRRAGFNPEVEDVIFNYSQFYGLVTVECRFRSVKDACMAKGILTASLPYVTIHYLPDTCELGAAGSSSSESRGALTRAEDCGQED